MEKFSHRFTIIEEGTRRNIVNHLLMPAAEIIMGGNFDETNSLSARQQETIRSPEPGIDALSIGFSATQSTFNSILRPNVLFVITQARLFSKELSQLGHLAINQQEEPLTDEPGDENLRLLDMEEFFEGITSLGVRIVEYKHLNIDMLTLQPRRTIDLLRFDDGRCTGCFQQNYHPTEHDDIQDPDLEEQMELADSEIEQYWDRDDILDIRFVLDSLGLDVAQR